MRYPRQKFMQKQTSTREKLLEGSVAFTFCWKSLSSLLSDPNSDCEWPENSNWHLLIRPHWLLNQAFGHLGNQSEEGLKNQAEGRGLCGTRWDQDKVKGFSMTRHSSVRLFPACLDLTTWQCAWQVNKF